MIELNREGVFRTAQVIYERKFGLPLPSNVVLATAVDGLIAGFATRETKAEMLGGIAEKKAMLLPLENASPVSQETFDICDAVIAAIEKTLSEMN